MIFELEAHIGQPDVGVIDPLHAAEEVRETARAVLIEHLHRHYCGLGSHTDDPRAIQLTIQGRTDNPRHVRPMSVVIFGQFSTPKGIVSSANIQVRVVTVYPCIQDSHFYPCSPNSGQRRLVQT
jgi:hypothetical protein